MKLHKDIYTEAPSDPDTLKNLGPLQPMAGIWEGDIGHDNHPITPKEDDGTRERSYFEHYELQPIDPQTNGPQLFYGLRYHTHIVKIGEVETFHDQVGYWLWEPNDHEIYMTLAIPRGQVALYSGRADPKAKTFELVAKRGNTSNGICSNPFLEQNFTTTDSRIIVTTNNDGTWSYNETATMVMPDRKAPFLHTDHHVLKKVGEPTPNPLAAQAKK